MRCQKCARNLGLFFKTCPRCKTPVTPAQIKRRNINFIAALIFFLLLTPLFFVSLKSADIQSLTNFSAFILALITAAVTVGFWAGVLVIISSIIHAIIRHPLGSGIVIVIIVLLGGFGFFAYYLDQQSVDLTASLNLIEDNLSEATVVKILGDSIAAKKPLAAASWERVQMTAELASERLAELSVPQKLEGYRQAAKAWCDQIAAAAQKPETWDKVADQPGSFELVLSKKEANQMLAIGTKKLSDLKEFGDTAIAMKNKDSMLYIGAKIRVQRYWLNAVLYSKDSGWLAFNFTASALAAQSTLPEIPEVGEGVNVTCQVCADPNVTMTQSQWQSYGCARCAGAKPPIGNTNTNTNNKTNTNNTQGFSNTNGGSKTGGTNAGQPGAGVQSGAGNVTGDGAETNQAGQTAAGPAPRSVCIGRGGTATGAVTTHSTPGNVYCLEEIIQQTNGIDASAIGFSQGNKEAEKKWADGWHYLEGNGIITETPKNENGRTPAVQAFFDECTARGGIVGGANQNKGRLPTTEFGYHCGYKNSAGNECWDYLTYSGGRYLGGNSGCQEKNLLPNIGEEQYKKNQGGRWDGHYTGSFAIKCTTNVPERPSFATQAPMDFTVINNVTYDQPVNTYIRISDSGSAIEQFQMSQGSDGVTVSLNFTGYLRFAPSGSFTINGSFNAVIVREDGVYSGYCSANGGGAKVN